MQPKLGFLHRLWRLIYPLLIWFGASFAVEFAFVLYGSVKAYADTSLLQGMEPFQVYDYVTRYAIDFVSENSMLLTCVADALAAVILLIFFLLDAKKIEKSNPLTTLKIKSPIAFVSCACVSVASCILFEMVLSFIIAIVLAFGGSTESFDAVSDMITNSSITLQIITVVIVGPICEELLMRALIFKRMRHSHGFLFSAILSSAVFGIIHGNWVQFIYAFAVGFLLAYVYEMTGNIFIPILFHVAANGVSTLMTTDALSPYFTNLMYGNLIGGMLTLVLCSAAIASGLIAMNKIYNTKKSEIS